MEIYRPVRIDVERVEQALEVTKSSFSGDERRSPFNFR